MRYVLLRVVNPMITGFFAILPVVITVAVIGWVASYVASYLGPDSSFGRAMSDLGAIVVDSDVAYVIGLCIVLAGLYVLGLLIQSRLRSFWVNFFNEVFGRLPLIGTIYKTIARFVQLLDKRDDDVDVKSMSPVWCYFSDQKRSAVLGLLASSETVELDGEIYRVVMVPTAPVPFGGGLLFLPEDWVKPANFGVEGLTNIYVSMGVTAPDYMSDKGATAQIVRKPPAPPDEAPSG
ncbi:MAG: DUF502 domain-containing protein [Pseudomonadota bacterium]